MLGIGVATLGVDAVETISRSNSDTVVAAFGINGSGGDELVVLVLRKHVPVVEVDVRTTDVLERVESTLCETLTGDTRGCGVEEGLIEVADDDALFIAVVVLEGDEDASVLELDVVLDIVDVHLGTDGLELSKSADVALAVDKATCWTECNVAAVSSEAEANFGLFFEVYHELRLRDIGMALVWRDDDLWVEELRGNLGRRVASVSGGDPGCSGARGDASGSDGRGVVSNGNSSSDDGGDAEQLCDGQ